MKERGRILEPVERKAEVFITEFKSGTMEMDGFNTMPFKMKLWLLDLIIKDVKKKLHEP